MDTIVAETRPLATSSKVEKLPFTLAGPSPMVVLLSSLVAVLAALSSGVGVFSTGGPGEYTFKTLHGETVKMFGHGIYRFDTLFQGTIFRGSDVAMLLVGIPLLVAAVLWYRRGSLRGRLVLLGTLAYFVYFYANVAMGAAYTNLYLVYVAAFGASVYAFALCARSIDLHVLQSRFSQSMPRHAPARFLFVAGIVTAVIWLSDAVGALVQGQPMQHLDSYTTSVTYVLDLGIIMPACFVAGYLVLRRSPLGYLMALGLLGIVVPLGPTILAQTISQVAGGVTLTTGAIIGPVLGFLALSLIAIWIAVVMLRNISDSPPTASLHL